MTILNYKSYPVKLLLQTPCILLFLSFICNTVATPIIEQHRIKETFGVRSVNRLKRTIKFNGMRKRLYIAALLSSGTIIPFIVPILGKYIPTHISKRFMARNDDVALPAQMTIRKAQAATPKTITANCSGFIFSIAIEKMDEPAMQHTMKVEKITPKGSPSKLSPISSFANDVNAGVHMNTKIYIDPSNSDDMIPQDKISGLRIVAENAPFNALEADVFFPSSDELSSPLVSP